MKKFILLLCLLLVGCAAPPIKVIQTAKVTAWNPFSVRTPELLWFVVHHHVTYKRDNPQYWQSPISTYHLRTGDCEDINGLLCSCLRASGYNAIIVLGDTDDSDHQEIDHAWCAILRNGTLYMMDATHPPPNPFVWENLQMDRWLKTRRWTIKRFYLMKDSCDDD